MTVWPFIPDDGMVETLTWSTDVLRAKNAEQRLALRQSARQGFQMSHSLLDADQLARAMAIEHGVGVDDLYIPVWAEYTVIGSISAGAGSLMFDTLYADYRLGVALIWETDEAFEVVQVADVTDTKLTLAGTVQNNYTRALVMPLRTGYMPQGISVSRISDRIATVSVVFEVTDNAELVESTHYAMFDGHDVLTDEPVVTLSDTSRRDYDLIDNGFGRPARLPVYNQQTAQFGMRWSPLDRATLWSLRRWLHGRNGKQKAFWLPSWGKDLTVVADIGATDTQIAIRPIGYATHYGTGHIAIMLKSGVTYYREVTASSSGSPELLTIAALGVNVSVSEIDRVSILRKCRLSDDRVEIAHRAGIGAQIAVRCEVVA